MEANPETGPTATVRFQCLWNDHYNLAQNLLGQWSGTPPNNLVNVAPANYPPSPNLICTSISSIEPLGKPWLLATNFLGQTLGLPWVTKKYVILTAHFTRPPYQPTTSGGYFSINFASSGEFLTLPDTVYQFADGTPTATPIGIPIVSAQITVTRYKMGFLPDQQMIALTNTLNNAPFQIGNNIYPAFTLLFGPGNSDEEADVLGNITYQAQYRFFYRPINWQYEFHPNRTTGWALVTDGNGNPKFQTENFGLLP
jgi:hypothetical protein